MRTFSITATVTEYSCLEELPSSHRDLVLEARRARIEAYAPYSNFLVGAALLLSDGKILRGANQENASYGMTVCAERTAIWRAWMQGDAGNILGIAIAGGMRGEVLGEQMDPQPIRPCGACRQVMSEAQFRAQRSIFVLLDSLGGALYEVASVEDLLPLAFDPRTLGIQPSG